MWRWSLANIFAAEQNQLFRTDWMRWPLSKNSNPRLPQTIPSTFHSKKCRCLKWSCSKCSSNSYFRSWVKHEPHIFYDILFSIRTKYVRESLIYFRKDYQIYPNIFILSSYPFQYFTTYYVLSTWKRPIWTEFILHL